MLGGAGLGCPSALAWKAEKVLAPLQGLCAPLSALTPSTTPLLPLSPQARTATLGSLERRAGLLVEALNAMEGVSCNPAEGALYAFPRITIPTAAVEAAKRIGAPPSVPIPQCLHCTHSQPILTLVKALSCSTCSCSACAFRPAVLLRPVPVQASPRTGCTAASCWRPPALWWCRAAALGR